VAEIGRCPVTAGELLARIAQLRTISDVEKVVRGLAGSYHVAASVGGQVWVRGSAAGSRLVFHVRLEDTTIAADRADVLATAIGADLDETQLALRLLSLPPPYPVDSRSPWRGIESVRPDHGLLIEPDGQTRTSRWWSPPDPVRTAADGASYVGQALTAAVDSCTAGGGTVSADLSGGMDSTSLCFLAARGPAELVTLHWTGDDPANDDSDWAARAGAELPGTHRVMASRLALWYEDLAGEVSVRAAATEEPGVWVRDSARWAVGAATTGARLHLVGGGGDELFTAPPQHLHSYVRSDPLAALGRIRRLRAVHHVPLRPLLRGLADRRTFVQWLTNWGAQLDGPAPPGSHFPLAWGPELRMPPWATPEAINVVRGLVREAAEGNPEALSPERGQHMAIASVRATARNIRLVNQAYATGPEAVAPYLDDAVIEAALSVRVAERNAPARYKPVLADAVSSVVPAFVLGRSTKGEYSADLYRGLRQNREAMVDLFADSALARAGLVDADLVRTSLLGLHPGTGMMQFLDGTLGCELWLRARQTSDIGVSL
jgi:asparagine synthase (glutamine-hydrolysing)